MPNYQIALVKLVESPLPFKNQFEPGYVFAFDWPLGFDSIYLNDLPISRWKNHKGFATLGLVKKDSYFYGEKFANKFLSHTEHTIFFHIIKIMYNTPKQISKLRLPAKVISQIDNQDPDTLFEEQKTMRRVLEKENGSFKISCGQLPIQSKIVSKFASPRKLPNGDTYYHSGVDFRAAMGSPIKASMPGEVSFAGLLTIPGNVVVLDHGGGIYSRYLHLDKINVQEGQTVKQGEVIGLSGATGRAEAPHLHWEILWKGNHADPHRYLAVAEQLCDPK